MTDDERDAMLADMSSDLKLMKLRQEQIIKDFEESKLSVGYIKQHLFYGNGRPSILSRLDILEGVGAVSVVGDGIGGDPAKLQRARRVAAEAGIEIVAMSTSPLRVSLFCQESQVDGLVRVLHGAFRERQG